MNIKAVIDRFEEDKAVIITDDKQVVSWPKNLLPDNIREGATIYINITESEEEEKKERARAKDILNEILDTKEE